MLALLAERPAHGFALSQLLAEDGEVGQVWTMPRPRVYRALDDLRDAGLIEEVETEPSDRGPARTIFASTQAGSDALEQLAERLAAQIGDAEGTRELVLRFRLAQAEAARDYVGALIAE